MSGTYPDSAGVEENLGRRTFSDRDADHQWACNEVRRILHGWGYETFLHGIEQTKELAQALQKQDDTCSLMVRFRPDLVSVMPTVVSFLCEIKAPGIRSERFSMEARAYAGLVEWNRRGRLALLLYAQRTAYQTLGEVVGCWVSEVDKPETVWVPRRPDWKAQWDAMGKIFPGVRRQECRHNPRSSGTPFVVLSPDMFDPLAALLPAGRLWL